MLAQTPPGLEGVLPRWEADEGLEVFVRCCVCVCIYVAMSARNMDDHDAGDGSL